MSEQKTNGTAVYSRVTEAGERKRSYLQDVLQCALCLKDTCKPRTLPCHHTYCLVCLEKHQKQGTAVSAENKFKCPACLTFSALPPGGLEAVPENVFIHTLREVVRMVEAGEDGRPCSRKGCNQPNYSYCKTACRYLCQTHHDSHTSSPFTEDHVSLSLKEAEEFLRQQLPPCPKHDGQHMEMLCKKCCIPACPKCIALHHEGHGRCELSKEMPIYQEQLQNTLSDVDQAMKHVAEAIENSQHKAEQVNTDLEAVAQEGKQVFNQLHQYLEEKETSFLAGIQHARDITHARIDAVKESQQTRLHSLRSVKLYGNELQGRGTPYDFALNTASLHYRFNTYSPQDLSTFTWNFSTNRRSVDTPFRGNVGDVRVVDQDWGTGRRPPHELASVELEWQEEDVSGLVHYQGWIVVVHTGHDYIYMYLIGGGLQVKSRVEGMIDPRGMTLVREDSGKESLVITDHKKALWWVAIEIQQDKFCFKKAQRQKLQFIPNEVSSSPTGHKVFVADEENHRIHIFDLAKNVVQLQLDEDISPVCVLSNQDDEFVVVDSAHSQLVWVNSQGQVSRIYHTNNKRPDHALREARGILIVSSWHSHSVELVAEDGTQQGEFVSEKDSIQKPQRVCMGPGGLYVAHRNSDNQARLLLLHYPPPVLPDNMRRVTVKVDLLKNDETAT